MYILCSLFVLKLWVHLPVILPTVGTMWISGLRDHLFWFQDMPSLHILSPGQQPRNHLAKHFAILAQTQELISVSFLHIHTVLLSIYLWRKHRPKSLVSRATDGTDKSPINMCTDKFLSVGIDPRKRSPVDAIALSKPLITLSCVSFCILETQSHTLKPTLGPSAANFTHASAKG